MLSRQLTKEDCILWSKNKKKNPITNYTLKDDSKILKEIVKKCTEILKNDEKQQPVHIKKKVQQPHVPLIPLIPLIPSKHPNTIVDYDNSLHYPDVDDPQFSQKIASLYEFNIHKIPKYPDIKSVEDFNDISNKMCNKFEKSYYQHFISQYISSRTPYKSILLYHAVGVGKTCSAITLSETFLIPHNMYDEPKIWVILPQALKSSFKEQIFNFENIPFDLLANQCSGETYINLLNITENSLENKSKLKQNVKKLINSRYKIFTYDAFSKFIEQDYKNVVKDKIIIIDEVHNIRNTEKESKQIFTTLKNVLSNGVNNRLVLLTATPMYNEPTDILDLFYLLLLNDKRFDIIDKYKNVFENQSMKIDDDILILIKKLSSTYISYLRGKDPFTFALKLSPKDSGIKVIKDVPTIDPFGKSIPTNELNWISIIEDGVVPSLLSKLQMTYINSTKDVNENNIFNNLQPMNIVFDNEIGEKGFYTFFTKSKDTDPLCVKYNKKYNNALLPDEEHLGLYSGKFLNICNFIRKTTGVVVIYSRYRYSGILPLAVCLEHMGFSREGTNNILEKATIIDNVKYDGIKTPKYCILSSENKDIMGSTTIDKLIKKINDPKNINGSLVKVILITPVASEGLSFYNTREIHLIEPWYHFNRSVQIIGRGIRNCRHQQLELEQKNTTVFMHSSVHENNSRESIDLHALRISTRKYAQSNIIDTIIRDNSIDCYLMKNVNYFPKELFKLGKIIINTSQGVKKEHYFGDDILNEPKCNVHIDKIDKRGYRKENYKHFVGNVRTLLRNILLSEIRKDIYYIPIDIINQNITDYDSKIIYEAISTSIYPNTLIDGYTLVPHENGLHIIRIKPISKNKISISFDDVKKISIDQKPKTHIVKVNKQDINSATVALYSSMDSNTFQNMMSQFLELDIELNETQEYIQNILFIQGVLIKNDEIKSFKYNNNTFIGYINIFNVKDDIDVILYNNVDKKYRDGTDNEKKELISCRKKSLDIPDITKETKPWGAFVPSKKKDVFLNIFKLFTIGESAGKKTGMNCISLKKQEHVKIFNELHMDTDDSTKILNCTNIANHLLSINRLTLLPIYKPMIL